MTATIGVDVGATKVAAALVDAEGNVLATDGSRSRVGEYDDTLDEIVSIVSRLCMKAGTLGVQAKAVGVAVAAFLDPDRTHVVHAANLDWYDRPLLSDLQSRLDLPVTVANDADAAAWGEHAHGGGARHTSLVLITVGTGVGAGVIVRNQLVTGASGLGGEIGHIPVVLNGRPCPCGGRGCLEQYASGTALRRAAQTRAEADPGRAERLLALVRHDAAAIDGPDVVDAARAGDPVALAAFEEIGGWLGVAVAHVVATLDPPVVLLGGGLAAAGKLLMDPVHASYAEHVGMPALRTGVAVELAQLGALAGVVGAAALARTEVGAKAPMKQPNPFEPV